ncbi:hypothetical protein ENBRE01_1502 [Enteropsectra breve]|nr:hypothetical protein ENBRE01_1502 [Enteropsectra breve]
MATAMLHMFNRVLRTGEIPLIWQDCTVVPVFKKGDPHNPGNYRGISLINTLLKVFTKVLTERIHSVVTTHSLIRREKAGFRPGEECTAQVATLVEAVQRRHLRNKNTIMCFLDLQKAYDMVPHDALIHKLTAKGLGPLLIQVIREMYRNTYIRVRIGSMMSPRFKYERGVRKGCPMSPLLFDMFIDDLVDDMNGLQIPGLQQELKGLLFADDTVIFAENQQQLEMNLKCILTWMGRNGMAINVSKCGILAVGPPSVQQRTMYGTEEIPIVDRYVYPGVEMNRALNLDEMAKYRVSKGRKVLGALTRSLVNRLMPIEFKKMLTKSILIPTLKYGCELYGLSEKRSQPLKRVLDNSIKLLVGSRRFPRARTYEELGIQAPYLTACVARSRALAKWRLSNCLIRYLISSHVEFKSRKLTWVKVAYRWYKVLKIDLDSNVGTIKDRVLQERASALMGRDRTLASAWARENEILDGKEIHRLETAMYGRHQGFMFLLRIRTRTFVWTKELACLGKVPHIYSCLCPLCDEPIDAELDHLMLQCRSLDGQRHKIVDTITKVIAVDRTLAENTLAKMLGARLSSGKKARAHRELVLICTEFLGEVFPLRAKRLAEIMKEYDYMLGDTDPPEGQIISQSRGVTRNDFHISSVSRRDFAPEGMMDPEDNCLKEDGPAEAVPIESPQKNENTPKRLKID